MNTLKQSVVVAGWFRKSIWLDVSAIFAAGFRDWLHCQEMPSMGKVVFTPAIGIAIMSASGANAIGSRSARTISRWWFHERRATFKRLTICWTAPYIERTIFGRCAGWTVITDKGSANTMGNAAFPAWTRCICRSKVRKWSCEKNEDQQNISHIEIPRAIILIIEINFLQSISILTGEKRGYRQTCSIMRLLFPAIHQLHSPETVFKVDFQQTFFLVSARSQSEQVVETFLLKIRLLVCGGASQKS